VFSLFYLAHTPLPAQRPVALPGKGISKRKPSLKDDELRFWARNASLKDLKDADADFRKNETPNKVIRERILMRVTEDAFIESRKASRVMIWLTIAILGFTAAMTAFAYKTYQITEILTVRSVRQEQTSSHPQTEPNHTHADIPHGNEPAAPVPTPPHPSRNTDPEQDDGDNGDKRLP
jgi:hypothetical protein